MENFIASDLGFTKPTGAFATKGEIVTIVENRRQAEAEVVENSNIIMSTKPNLMSIISATLIRVKNMAVGL